MATYLLQVVLLLASCACASSASVLSDEIAKDIAWASYKSEFHKDFSDNNKEKTSYYAWKDMLTKITEHNEAFQRGESTFEMGINKYSDLTPEQYKTLLGLKIPPADKLCEPPMCQQDPSPVVSNRSRVARAPLPPSIDWRARGYVTRVKDQISCGSCWTFSSTGSLEGQMFRKTGRLVELSEQNLLDCCDNRYGGNGCNGGWLISGYLYVINNQGIDMPYVYEGQQGPCRFNRNTVAGTCVSFTRVDSTEAALEEAVANVGPIAVAVHSGLESFQAYRRGIYSDPACNQQPDHAVLVVGYGTENGQKYWLIKNSWSEWWGMDGYMKLARDANQMCGIGSHAYYPHV